MRNIIPTGEFILDSRPAVNVIRDCEPCCVARDICEVFEINNSRMALERLDDDDKS